MKRIAAAVVMACMLLQGAQALEGTEWIRVSEEFTMEEAVREEYPAVMMRGGAVYDAQEMARMLLGEGMIGQGDGRYCEDRQGEVWEKKTMRHDAQTGAISYYDPMIAGERGAEYEAPPIGTEPGEALAKCRALLGGILPEEELLYVSAAREAAERWHAEEERLMGDEEYAALYRERKLAYFRFEHRESGLCVLGEGLTASIGVNGLNGFELVRHEFEPGEETAELMPLEEALEMASSTRSAEAVLLYAQPVYSNWVSGDERYHLCWYLATSGGNYVVDCVLGQHRCDSWEY